MSARKNPLPPPVLAPATTNTLKTLRNKLASLARSRLILGSIIFCAALSVILATSRFGLKRLVVGTGSIRPLYPTLSRPARPITTSTMAPSQYKKPPQVPPVFTATPQSLIDDTRRLVSANSIAQALDDANA